jgi:hypothetical protein
MRQSAAERGDDGWLMRVPTAQICLLLLSIIDTLIDLLARFRAGTLPPILPARDPSDKPSRATAARHRRLSVSRPAMVTAKFRGSAPQHKHVQNVAI